MIVAHSLGLIFVKTRKTAGTSVEIALSQHCRRGDIITPVTPEDEELRRSITDVGPQKYRIPVGRIRRVDLRRARRVRKWPSYFNHFPAHRLHRNLGAATWGAYSSFAFDRNPWDMLVSRYWFDKRFRDTDGGDFSRWLRRSHLSNYPIYADATGRTPLVDVVYRYEDGVQEQVDKVFRDHGLPTSALPRAKSNFRRTKKDWRSHYTDEDAAYVAEVCHREIALLGYKFDPPGTT